VRSALIYPAILTIVAMGSVTILLTYVLPKFATIFAQARTGVAAVDALLDWAFRRIAVVMVGGDS
jgi:general secretion pathway protein F